MLLLLCFVKCTIKKCNHPQNVKKRDREQVMEILQYTWVGVITIFCLLFKLFFHSFLLKENVNTNECLICHFTWIILFLWSYFHTKSDTWTKYGYSCWINYYAARGILLKKTVVKNNKSYVFNGQNINGWFLGMTSFYSHDYFQSICRPTGD